MYAIDIPTAECVGNDDAAWKTVAMLPDKASALQFIRDNFGPCDDEGKVCLITQLQDDNL